MNKYNKYKFSVMVCGGYCNGYITVEANCLDEATEKAMDSFVSRWIETFPELDVDYNVEIESVEINEEEIERKIQKAMQLCPGDEELEIAYDGFEARVLRYKELRGSAISIDGMGDDEVLWDSDDTDYDENFDEKEIIKSYDVYVSGF